MFGLETLDVLIGLVTVYLVFGIACTAVVEAIAAWLGVRSKGLEQALKGFFDGNLDENTAFMDAFFSHPLVRSLGKSAQKPSYIPTEIVGAVVEALLDRCADQTSIEAAVKKMPETSTEGGKNQIKYLLESFLRTAEGDLSKFRACVEKHFDAVMDRASGWFKRRQQLVALLVSIGLVGFANLDTVSLANSLVLDPELRAGMVKMAEKTLAEAKSDEEEATQTGSNPTELSKAREKTDQAIATLSQARDDLTAVGFQIGWRQWPRGSEWLSKIIGLLVSIFAISLGAPFWFDVLKRFMRVRGAGVAPGEKQEKKCEDT